MSDSDAQMNTEGIRHNGMVFQSFEVFLTNAQVKNEDNANSASVMPKAAVLFQKNWTMKRASKVEKEQLLLFTICQSERIHNDLTRIYVNIVTNL